MWGLQHEKLMVAAEELEQTFKLLKNFCDTRSLYFYPSGNFIRVFIITAAPGDVTLLFMFTLARVKTLVTRVTRPRDIVTV